MKTYFPGIDFIKTFAIFSVVLLHILAFNGDKSILYNLFAPFHIWQAVPLFMLVFGFTFRLSIEKNYSLSTILSSRVLRLIFPLFIAYFLSFLPIFIFEIQPAIDWHIFIGALPTSGMGNYFITLYIETLFFFILLYYLVKKFNKYFIIIFASVFSMIGELIAYSINIIDPYMYSSSIHRYARLVVLGYYFYDTLDDRKNYILLILSGVSSLLLYFFTVSHLPLWPYSEYQSAVNWGFQHFPYALYTVLLALVLLHIHRLINNKILDSIFKSIGKSSFHIFLAQLFVFQIERYYGIEMNIMYAVLTLFFSFAIGLVWYKLEESILTLGSKNARKHA